MEVNAESASQVYEICGGTLHTAKDACYFAMVKCTTTGHEFKTYDYIFVQDLIKKDVFIGKIHSIYMERKSHSLCMEVQYFPILPQDQDPEAEPLVSEATQTLLLLQIDMATVFIKPASVMYLPPSIQEDHTYSYVCENVKSYKEVHENTADDEMQDVNDASSYEGSFIASEGTCTVYGSSDDNMSDDNTSGSDVEMTTVRKSHGEVGSGKCNDKEVTMYFYYNKLDLKNGSDLERPDLVPAIEPVLLDLVWSYNCNVCDVTGEAYQALVQHVSMNYFSGNEEKTLLALRDPRYIALKAMVDEAIKVGDGGLVDPYKFFMILTS